MLQIFSIEQSEQWDKIVRSFKEYDIYWLSGYVKAFKLHGDGEPQLYYFDDSRCRGINVIMKRDIAADNRFRGKISENSYWDIISPYGYGGWIIEGDETERLFDEYEQYCEKNRIICEFVRFHPMLKNHNYCERNYHIVPLGDTVVLDLESPEIIWNNFTSKNRNMIRKAKKNGIKIYMARNPDIYKIFRKIYNETMERDHAEEYYYFEETFYESILDDLPQNAQIFYAEYDEKIIAASIVLTANGRMNYHLSGSIKKYSSLAPTNLILYEMALWGNANGYKTLYLGGGVGSKEDSLYKFKKSFCRRNNTNKFYIGKKIFNEEKYNELCSLRNIEIKQNSLDEGFFPKYRN